MPQAHGQSRSADLNRELTCLVAASLTQSLPQRRLAAGGVLAHGGARLDHLPVVVSGRLQLLLMLGTQGHTVIPVSFGPGETAMLSSLFSCEPLSGDLVAPQDTLVRLLPALVLEDLFSRRSDLSLLLAKFFAARLREVQLRERGFLGKSVEARVLAALNRAAVAGGDRVLRMTHEQLAAWAAVSRPKTSLALKQLEREAQVELGRGWIRLLGPAPAASASADPDR